MDQITTALGVHSKSVERWEHHLETHGSANPPTPLRGRRRLLSSDIAEELSSIYRDRALGNTLTSKGPNPKNQHLYVIVCCIYTSNLAIACEHHVKCKKNRIVLVDHHHCRRQKERTEASSQR